MALELDLPRQRHLEQLELISRVKEGEVKPRGNDKGIGFPESRITLPGCVKCHAAFKQEEETELSCVTVKKFFRLLDLPQDVHIGEISRSFGYARIAAFEPG